MKMSVLKIAHNSPLCQPSQTPPDPSTLSCSLTANAAAAYVPCILAASLLSPSHARSKLIPVPLPCLRASFPFHF
jgi:hypothetical protein